MMDPSAPHSAGGHGGFFGTQAKAPPVRDVRVVVDSRSRDVAAFPSPNSYEVDLPEDLFSVHSMQLLCAQVPFSSPTVPSGAAQRVTVRMEGGATPVTAVLPAGDYTGGADVAAALATALDAAAGDAGLGATFAVAHLARLDTLEIRSTESFVVDAALLAEVPATARLLGFAGAGSAAFAAVNDGGGAGYPWVVTAPARRVDPPHPYIVLRMRAPSADTINSPSDAVHRTFAVLPHPDVPVSVFDDEAPFRKRWTPPLARIARIRVELLDPDGAPYDFRGRDHRLDLLFTVAVNRSV